MQGIIDGNVAGMFLVSLTLNPASIAPATSAEQDFTVPGVLATDHIIKFDCFTPTAGVGVVNYRVKSANTISVVFMNATAGAIDPPAANYHMAFFRADSDLLGGLPS